MPEPTLETISADKTKTYKVFISYCWTSEKHENWVYELATKLMHSGIDVAFDKWSLKEGQDKYAFMESMVNDLSVDKVLVICDKGYKEKADKRKGGVGTETQIITAELYGKVHETKFIPIIAEHDENFESCMPTFIKSRIGIDLSNPETFEDEFENLLRAIVERPKNRKPTLGKLPSFLFEDEVSTYKTKTSVAMFKNNIFKNSKQALLLSSDFFENFMEIFSSFVIDSKDFTEPYDEIIFSKIHDMKNLRNDYIEFFDSYLKNQEIFKIDKIIKLFEDMSPYTEFRGSGQYNTLQFDHYKFFIWELFLYTIAMLLKNEDFYNIKVLLDTKYFLNLGHYQKDTYDFKHFNFANIRALEYRGNRLGENLLTCTSHLLCERSVVSNQNFKNLLTETDLLLFYYSALKYERAWFPASYVYATGVDKYSVVKIDILKRLISKRHFEKVKVLFDVNTPQEMIELFKTFNEEKYKNYGYERSFETVPFLSYHINFNEIATSI